MKLIGIGGTNGSGKDTVGKLLANKYGYIFISVTDLLRAELAKRGLPPSRDNMRDLSAQWRRESGLGVLVDKAVAQLMEAGDKHAGLVVASLRNPGEADRVHQLDGLVMWVDADPKLRYERIQSNLQARGDVRAVDDKKTFEEFMADEDIEMRRQAGSDDATLDMSAVKSKADLLLENNYNNLSELQTQLELILAGNLTK